MYLVACSHKPDSSGDMYLVACDRGYELIGDEELICGSDGETNTFFGNPDDYPECVYLPGPCAKPRITNGWLTYDQGEFEIPYREETFVVCNGPNYGPKQTLVTCMGNNQWEPPIPVCTWRGKEIFSNFINLLLELAFTIKLKLLFKKQITEQTHQAK